MKIWVIILNRGDERQKLRAYLNRDEAVAEMQKLKQQYNKHWGSKMVSLQKVDGLLVLSFGTIDSELTDEKVVMTELEVDNNCFESGKRTINVWIITLKGSDERQKLRPFYKREEAVAEMEGLYKHYNQRMRHTDVVLEEVDGLLVMSFNGTEENPDGEMVIRYEEAVMTELTVDSFKMAEKSKSQSGLLDNGWQPAPECENLPA